MPSVIRLNRYVNAPYKGVNLTRQNIFNATILVWYCGAKRDLYAGSCDSQFEGALIHG